jgi:Spy/CpxP family protein refolding chaperone
MKNKWIAAVGVLALSTSIAVAAPHGGKFGGKRGHGEFGAKFAEKLNLTEAQKAQIQTIRKETREQNTAFFEQFRATMEQFRAAKEANDGTKIDALKGNFEAQRAQMKQIRDAEKQRILSVLTADQRAQYEQFEAQRAQRHPRRQH